MPKIRLLPRVHERFVRAGAIAVRHRAGERLRLVKRVFDLTHHRRHDMKPTDPVPDGIVAPNHRAWRGLGTTHDILNYSNSLWSKSRGFMIFQADQPVVEAALISTRRDFLDDTLRDEDVEPQQCFLILEPMRISPVSMCTLCQKDDSNMSYTDTSRCGGNASLFPVNHTPGRIESSCVGRMQASGSRLAPRPRP